jgi:gluconate 2-dehydrogenase gamma chain
MMDLESISRRSFLAHATRLAVAGWLTVELQLIVSCARDASNEDAGFAHLTVGEVRTLRAVASQIIPSVEGAPSANDLGAAKFVDRAFGMPFFAGALPLIRNGLADLDTRAHAGSERCDFADASERAQIALLQDIESTPFFASVRTLTVIGTFADPSYGGNRASEGWALLGLEHRPSFVAPFGWYDAAPAPIRPGDAA